ncbi:MAG: chemotaxis protein CheW [Actinomycetota bacterium]
MKTDVTTLQLCTFRLGSLYLGVNVLDVQEVLYRAEVCRVPHADPAISGLINLRGQIATTIDMRTRLGIEPRDPESQPIHVVVRSAGESVNLLVDKIGDVLAVDPDLYEPPPETISGIAKELILGAYKLTDELLLILDVDKAVAIRPGNGEVSN